MRRASQGLPKWLGQARFDATDGSVLRGRRLWRRRGQWEELGTGKSKSPNICWWEVGGRGLPHWFKATDGTSEHRLWCSFLRYGSRAEGRAARLPARTHADAERAREGPERRGHRKLTHRGGGSISSAEPRPQQELTGCRGATSWLPILGSGAVWSLGDCMAWCGRIRDICCSSSVTRKEQHETGRRRAVNPQTLSNQLHLGCPAGESIRST